MNGAEVDIFHIHNSSTSSSTTYDEEEKEVTSRPRRFQIYRKLVIHLPTLLSHKKSRANKWKNSQLWTRTVDSFTLQRRLFIYTNYHLIDDLNIFLKLRFYVRILITDVIIYDVRQDIDIWSLRTRHWNFSYFFLKWWIYMYLLSSDDEKSSSYKICKLRKLDLHLNSYDFSRGRH